MFRVTGSIEAVVFTPAKTKIPGVRSEYYLTDSGVKFHLWPDPEFPKDLGESIREAWKGFPKETVVEEYVPEVDSWYAEIKHVGIGLSPVLIESLLSKIAKAVEKRKDG